MRTAARDRSGGGVWDLTALLNAADPRAELAARNLWLVRLLEWLRHPAAREGDEAPAAGARPLPLLRLTHLLNMLERNPEAAARFAAVLGSVWQDMRAEGLFADVGFAPRMALWSEALHRLRLRLLPDTVDTRELGELFDLLFPDPQDAAWLNAMDEALLARLGTLFDQALPGTGIWRRPMLSGLTMLTGAVHAAGLSGPLRLRMEEGLLGDPQPFAQLPGATERFGEALLADDPEALAPALRYLRALLDHCRLAAESVPRHLEEFGVSVDIMFEVEQLLERLRRIEMLLDCLVSEQPQRELLRLTSSLVDVVQARRSLRTLFARHYSLLARKVAERSAETGEHYITRNAAEYRDMLRRAAGGGLVIAGTTFIKFAVMALSLGAFWAGFWAGANYALSFVLIQLLHWTVATKQPAMTAPAMAAKLDHVADEPGREEFVDEVAHLLRSQMAGIVGNLAVVAPVVLAVQLLCALLFGQTLVGPQQAEYVLHSMTLLGPTLLFAAFTGVLLFASSLIAGWVENWFVFHRLDAAIAWNPRIVARLGAQRAQRWAQWWRGNISGLAANVSLGLMLGLVPALLGFLALPLEVRHVTLSTGQIAAAAGALGWEVLRRPEFWWCVAAIPFTGLLNLSVSFLLAFKVALQSRGLKVAERDQLRAAIWRRLRQNPRSFFLPPRDSDVASSAPPPAAPKA